MEPVWLTLAINGLFNQNTCLFHSFYVLYIYYFEELFFKRQGGN